MAVSARDSKLLEQIQNLLAQVDYLTKKLFGTSSEKMKDVEGQLNLFDKADVDLKAPVIKVSEHTRKKNVLLRSFLKVRFQKGSRFETAVKYAQNRKYTLMTYLEDGHCSFSNNLSENAIRPFTVGRKNWLFSATPKGATASALVYTMVEMAKTNELNIYKYLTYLLEHRPSEDMSDEQLEALTPWSKEVQNVCKN